MKPPDPEPDAEQQHQQGRPVLRTGIFSTDPSPRVDSRDVDYPPAQPLGERLDPPTWTISSAKNSKTRSPPASSSSTARWAASCSRSLAVADYGGAHLENCTDNVVPTRTRTSIVRRCTRSYLEAGADIIETNSFNGHPLSLAEFQLQDATRTRSTAPRADRSRGPPPTSIRTPGRPRFVAGVDGADDPVDHGHPQRRPSRAARRLLRPGQGADRGRRGLLLLETCQDTRNVKAALLGDRASSSETGLAMPVMVSGTIEPMGTMLAGQAVEALLRLARAPRPALDRAQLRHRSRVHDRPPALARRDGADARRPAYPNAGLPDEDGQYLETPASSPRKLERFVDEGWLNMVGGCCGTTPAHIRAHRRSWSTGSAPRAAARRDRARRLAASSSSRPTTTTGRSSSASAPTSSARAQFKELIVDEKFEEAAEIARAPGAERRAGHRRLPRKPRPRRD